jgi:multidrug efflux pump subunit AcrB
MAPRQERKLAVSGGRFVAIGVPFVVVGLLLALLLDGTARGIGAAIGVLGAIPVVLGVALLLTGGVERRSRTGKPFA